MSVKEDDVVLCTVTKIENTTVFVDIDNNGKGSIAMSEVAAGRIRNLREHATVNKKIVCKVLKVTKDHTELSLRRVTAKEHDEVIKKYKDEKTGLVLLNSVLKNNKSALNEIMKNYSASDFLSQARSDSSLLRKFMGKAESDALQKILVEKKEKNKKGKKTFTLGSVGSNGLTEIKSILSVPDVKIKYLGSSAFTVEADGKDFKEANHKIDLALSEIEKKAREKKAVFELKKA